MISLGYTILQAQDSIDLYPKIYNQYNTERDLKNNLFYNPATMSDYSSSSFSDFSLNYLKDDKKLFRQQTGSKSEGFTILTNSFQKLNENKTIWGNANYQNQDIFNIKWNENLDFDRIAPYIIADSIGGNMNIEQYKFGGGYNQKINKWTLGLQADYSAQQGSRPRDPRNVTTTSDLSMKIGFNFNLYKDWTIGVFANVNKYTQKISVKFISDIINPYLYNMNGFGAYNYFFSNTNSSIHEEYGYTAGGQIINKKHDFYLNATLEKSKNTKKVTNAYYDISDLTTESNSIEIGKFYSFNQNRIGFIAQLANQTRTGEEYGYTNNTEITQVIFKRKAYRKETNTSKIQLYYELQKDKYSLAIIPFTDYQTIKESRLYPFNGQKYDCIQFGINLDFKQKIKNNQVLEFQPYYSQRQVINVTNALNLNNIDFLNDMVLRDYTFLTSDITTVGASLRYHLELDKIPAIFIGTQYQSQKIQNKNNNFTSLNLGITF